MRSRKPASLFDAYGNRKYLTQDERKHFLDAARNAPPHIMTFCMVLAYTGARLSEVLALQPSHIDPSMQCIVFKCLKKRGNVIYRAVPVPKSLFETLVAHHDLEGCASERLWPWCRTTAWAHVGDIMRVARLSGVHATSRGLRHAFAVSAVQAGVSLNMVQKWLGHADIETTSIYANAVGVEELKIAGRVWSKF